MYIIIPYHGTDIKKQSVYETQREADDMCQVINRIAEEIESPIHYQVKIIEEKK